MRKIYRQEIELITLMIYKSICMSKRVKKMKKIKKKKKKKKMMKKKQKKKKRQNKLINNLR